MTATPGELNDALRVVLDAPGALPPNSRVVLTKGFQALDPGLRKRLLYAIKDHEPGLDRGAVSVGGEVAFWAIHCWSLDGRTVAEPDGDPAATLRVLTVMTVAEREGQGG